LSRPFSPRQFSSFSVGPRVNGKIRAREVRVIGADGNQLGILSLGEALTKARALELDLVEVAPTAVPPVCRIVDYGKFRYERAKREKESKKHQHATKVKEVQLSAKIDPHDLGVKLGHAIDFLCDDMKVKLTLRFRGREMQHTEFGFQVVEKFLTEIAPFGHPDAEPKMIGRGINVMISPLPRNKRARNLRQAEGEGVPTSVNSTATPPAGRANQPADAARPRKSALKPATASSTPPASGFANNPFAELEIS
jgi:translation initiation factor IF-3